MLLCPKQDKFILRTAPKMLVDLTLVLLVTSKEMTKKFIEKRICR